MLLEEMNFRDIVDKYLYIDAVGVAQNIGSIFEVTDDVTGMPIPQKLPFNSSFAAS